MKNKQATRHILALLLAVALLIGMTVPVAQAAGTAQIKFGQCRGKRGEQVTVPVTITNNPGIASLRFRIAYDATALKYVSAAKGEVMKGGTLSAAYQEKDEKLAITWFDVKNITGDGVLFNLVFEITDTASGQYPLTVSYLPEDIANATWQQVDVTVEDGLIQVGTNVSGTITSFGAADEEITVKLMQGDTEIASTVTTDGTYQFASVAPGAYSLVITKAGHATQVYEITVADEKVSFDATIYLLGDFTDDGEVTNEDVIYLLWHTLFPESYPIRSEGDLTRDGEVTNEDVIYLLWHTLFPESYPLS